MEHLEERVRTPPRGRGRVRRVKRRPHTFVQSFFHASSVESSSKRDDSQYGVSHENETDEARRSGRAGLGCDSSVGVRSRSAPGKKAPSRWGVGAAYRGHYWRSGRQPGRWGGDRRRAGAGAGALVGDQLQKRDVQEAEQHHEIDQQNREIQRQRAELKRLEHQPGSETDEY